MSRRAVVVLLAGAILLVGIVAWQSQHGGAATRRAAREAPPEPAETPVPTRSPDPVAEGPAPVEPTRPVLDRAKRDQMRELIWHAIGHPSPPEEPPPSKPAAYVLPDRPSWEAPGHPLTGDSGMGIEAKYIQERVHEDFFPLARKCYTDALEHDPTLQGRMVLAFNIVGDSKTGGIVEAADVLNESTLRDPDVIDCIRQSLLSVTFRPPEGGGQVTVKYPIEFTNSDAEP